MLIAKCNGVQMKLEDALKGNLIHTSTQLIVRVGQNRIYTPYMTVCMVISLLIKPYVHRKYV
jgi:hypothetical protein